MKSLRNILIATVPLLALAAGEAAAATCYAKSPTGSWGWGSGGSFSYAKSRALYECSIRTPRWSYCRITRCHY